ncbi:glycosyltransferase involved in cell wall biosynthesis [Flavobacterium sp. 270]|uniref:glycosyltransferase family 2 protein n=1 Tax=Flavobacterium sp. 270 TaxID=2512114 RepID=UPI001066EC05|nr:glycosyltransferase family 2 protein [Flavobacterium sp. 270]TDW47146.1 glycosyltransferase involved in cell wall biosynthesis [Flavobacterium sp. 270]
MDNFLVSIIIPTYNRGHLIAETLNSISSQIYTNWECIIVDDGSDDNTEEVISEYVKSDSRFQFHHRPANKPKGGNAARNYGFELSKGDYVNWFDDDDIMLENFIANKILQIGNNINIIFCSGYIVDEFLKGEELLKLEIKEFLYKDYVLWNFQVITNSVLFKRSFLQDKVLFLDFLTRGQENELLSRLLFKMPKESYKYIDEPLFLYRQHDVTKTQQNKSYIFKNKESQAYTYIANFRRGINLKDKVLVDFFYYHLMVLYFTSYENNHRENRIFINKHITKSVYKNISNWDIILCFNFLTILNINSYKIYKYLSSKRFYFKK